MALSIYKIEEIEDRAEGLLEDTYNVDPFLTPPVNLEKVAGFLDLEIKIVDFNTGDISGLYVRSKKTILVSRAEPIVRQRFTIAHEIGHFILHNNAVPEEIRYRKDLSQLHDLGPLNEGEKEANWFAASLLMPREAIDYYWSFLGDISDLANKFRVSTSAASFRLKNLGKIK